MIFVRDIQAAVAREHGIDPAIMRESDGVGCRIRDHAWPRQEAMWLSLQLTNHSTVRIGQFFGNRDHSTVLSASRRVDERRSGDAEIHERMRRVTLELSRGQM